MTQLWPRLPAAPARILYEERRNLDVIRLVELSGVDHPRRTFAATGGWRTSNDDIRRLAVDLRTVAAEFGYPRHADDGERIGFDRAAAEVLYQRMQITTVEASNNEVWNFLALVAAPDLVQWRWPGSSNIERWISTDRTRHMFARLWWQAFTFGEPTPDGEISYGLLRGLAERDLNQITERRSLGGIPRLARGLARLIVADGVRDTDGSTLLRRLTPLLRRRVVFIDFASLTDGQIDDHLRSLRGETSTRR